MDFPEFDTFLSIYKRPHVELFLKYIKENCEGVLFCSGVKAYVDKVMVCKLNRFLFFLVYI
jgi:hypothetical protein